MSAFWLHGLFGSWWMVFHNTFILSCRLKWKAIALLIKIPSIYCIELEINSFWFNCPSFKMSVSNLCKTYIHKRWWVLARDLKAELRPEERKEKLQVISARDESPGFVFCSAIPCLHQIKLAIVTKFCKTNYGNAVPGITGNPLFPILDWKKPCPSSELQLLKTW